MPPIYHESFNEFDCQRKRKRKRKIAKKRPEIRYAFEIHAFIQRGSGNPAWQEKCYEKWMGQFSISQRPGPGAAAIFVHYTPTCMHLGYIGARTFIGKCTARKFRVSVHANQKSQTRDGIVGNDVHERGVGFISRLLI
ncbi:hypothetical protein K0M31_010484 [Melipona bicolor]|uniref:Uncharacterized protein n=1 Tax=Melipona bicolor TaxID=60889 RepID=A0AA40KI41_9HYME|nr:hypothetical protein K0M31_010484 [Melipona bicolor]